MINKKRDWSKYINNNTIDENRSVRADCQLVTCMNAVYHFTGKTIDWRSEEYSNLVKMVGAQFGSAICIDKAYKLYGFEIDKIYTKETLFINHSLIFKKNMFMEITIYHKRYGLHSCSIVDWDKKTQAVRITNLRDITSTNGWIFWEDIYPILFEGKNGCARTFKLKNLTSEKY